MGGGRFASTSSGSTLRSILLPCNKLRLSANQSEEFQITRAGKNLRCPVTASFQTAANVRRPRGLGAVRSPSLMRTGTKTFQGLSTVYLKKKEKHVRQARPENEFQIRRAEPNLGSAARQQRVWGLKSVKRALFLHASKKSKAGEKQDHFHTSARLCELLQICASSPIRRLRMRFLNIWSGSQAVGGCGRRSVVSSSDSRRREEKDLQLTCELM